MILANSFGDKPESSPPLKLDEVDVARFLPLSSFFTTESLIPVGMNWGLDRLSCDEFGFCLFRGELILGEGLSLCFRRDQQKHYCTLLALSSRAETPISTLPRNVCSLV
jgi:hypothetical protein